MKTLELSNLYVITRIPCLDAEPLQHKCEGVFLILSSHFYFMSPSQECYSHDNRSDVTHSGGFQTHSAEKLSDSAHHAKAKLLDDALQEIDMGRFQVCCLFLSSQ